MDNQIMRHFCMFLWCPILNQVYGIGASEDPMALTIRFSAPALYPF